MLLLTNITKAQDYFSLENTQKFADYLYKTKQFKYAAQEYERLVFLDSENLNNKLRLIESYRIYGNYEEGINKVHLFYNDTVNSLSNSFANEYVKLLLLNQSYDTAFYFVDKSTHLQSSEKNDYKLSAFLLKQDWQQAQKFALSNPPSGERKNLELILLANESAGLNYKNPLTGAIFSTILPGSGKMYARNWKDGIISLLFIAGNSWNAYSGFRKYGDQSVYGWIFGSLSFGFYLGNIYGSFKEVKHYNKRLDDEMLKKAESLIYSDF